jgi:hypothetical protein
MQVENTFRNAGKQLQNCRLTSPEPLQSKNSPLWKIQTLNITFHQQFFWKRHFDMKVVRSHANYLQAFAKKPYWHMHYKYKAHKNFKRKKSVNFFLWKEQIVPLIHSYTFYPSSNAPKTVWQNTNDMKSKYSRKTDWYRASLLSLNRPKQVYHLKARIRCGIPLERRFSFQT